MIVPLLLATACLELPPAHDTAYAALIGEGRWSCGEAEDLAAAARARELDGDVMWFRLDGRAFVLREPADLDEIGELLQPLRAAETELAALGGKRAEYAAERAGLEADVSRLSSRLPAYAPGSEKNRAVDADLTGARVRLHSLREREAGVTRLEDDARAETSRAFADARGRLERLLDRALRHGTALPFAD